MQAQTRIERGWEMGQLAPPSAPQPPNGPLFSIQKAREKKKKLEVRPSLTTNPQLHLKGPTATWLKGDFRYYRL